MTENKKTKERSSDVRKNDADKLLQRMNSWK